MAKYVDGFVLVVPKGKEAEYQTMAEQGRDSWMKHGALQYFECRGNDLEPQEAGGEKSRAFPEMADANNDENVWFSFIVFESKEHRDEVNKKVIAEMDESFASQIDFEMPTDMKKMAYGGFEVLVEGQRVAYLLSKMKLIIKFGNNNGNDCKVIYLLRRIYFQIITCNILKNRYNTMNIEI